MKAAGRVIMRGERELNGTKGIGKVKRRMKRRTREIKRKEANGE